MTRWFNIAGPCSNDIHYMLSPTVRLPDLEDLIQQRSYFVLHAPRQTGKTTAMLALSKQLTATGNYAAVMVSVEVGSAFNHDPSAAELAILGAWYNTINIRLPKELQPPVKQWQQEEPGNRIKAFLQGWAKAINRPIVLFIDEIDSLQDQTLISVLRQLRDGFPNRPENFPSSVGLIGLRDVRDYKVASGGSDRLNTSSPFNIKVASLTMRNFNLAEVGELYQKHTAATGQLFTPEAIETAYDLTQGQPWLVNALAKEIVEKMVKDRSIPITKEHILTAKEILIARQDTHLDKHVEKLEKTDEIRQKFLSYVMKYEKNPTKFFEDEIENFQYIANKMIKKISKVYGLAKDDEAVSESILNWGRVVQPWLPYAWQRLSGRAIAS